MPHWMVRSLGGEPEGPYSTEQIIAAVDEGDLGVEIEVTPQGEDKWLPIEMVPEFADLAFFDGETNVVDSPWFADLARRGGMTQPAKAPEPELKPVEVTQALPTDEPGARRGAGAPLAAAGAKPYAEEDVATKVVASPAELAMRLDVASQAQSEAPDIDETLDDDVTRAPVPSSNSMGGSFEAMPPSSAQPGDLYDDFDETMTRVAVKLDQQPSSAQPAPPSPGGGGVLPTLTMNRDYLPATVNQPAAEPPAPASQKHVAQFPIAPTVDAPAQPAAQPPELPDPPYSQNHVQSSYPPVPQAQGGPPDPSQPPAYDPMHYPHGQQGHPYEQAEPEGSETGIKALIVLIVILAMALTVVLVLLVSQP